MPKHREQSRRSRPEKSEYEKLAKIGQGSFGEVFKARDKKTKDVVALKKVLMDNEKRKLPFTTWREIRLLQLMKHDNIVNLLEVCGIKDTPYRKDKKTVYLVFEYCEHDLAGLVKNCQAKFSLAEIKDVMQQLFNGLYYIHCNRILHRDVKSANILINKAGQLKLADFGLSRDYRDKKVNCFTNKVMTLWYRPPELLLGECNYTPAIDMWGAGCVMAEMWTKCPIMQGNTEQHQLMLISHLCGSIVPAIWPGVEKLDLFTKINLPQGHKRRVKERLHGFVNDQMALDLLDKLLSLDPTKRANANEALNHDFFWSDPLPQNISTVLDRLSMPPPKRPAMILQPAQARAVRPAYHNPDQLVEMIY